PRTRRLQLRGVEVPGRLRGRAAARRLRAGHRGPDAGQPVSGHGERSRDHSRAQQEDRKSTCLNSSHVSISYAVFCLQKKTTPHQRTACKTRTCAILSWCCAADAKTTM